MTGTSTGTKLLAIVLGLWVLLRSVNKDSTGRTLIDHILGNSASQSPLLGTSLPTPSSSFTGNPFPGATGSRVDQGFDLTTKQFLAPFAGKVLVANQTDPGWKGGGYLAIQDSTNPKRVIFMAEGIAPTVQAGQTVTAGQSVGIPVSNPYNFVVGNIESGWADPKNPTRPLAQAVSNKPAAALSFYNWLRSLGGPTATATTGAGFP